MMQIKNLCYHYKGCPAVLKDVSFKIEPKQTVAFVGATDSVEKVEEKIHNCIANVLFKIKRSFYYGNNKDEYKRQNFSY